MPEPGGGGHHKPALPFTESISVAGSKPTPVGSCLPSHRLQNQLAQKFMCETISAMERFAAGT